MKSIFALFQQKSVPSFNNNEPSSSFPDIVKARSRPSIQVEAFDDFAKKRPCTLSMLVGKFFPPKRVCFSGRNGEVIANPSNLEKYLRRYPLMKSGRLEAYCADLPLDATGGIGELSVQSLSRLPRRLASEIAVMRRIEIVQVAVIDAVWDALETNTELFEEKFNLVGKAVASAHDRSCPIDQVAARFSDALPARDSAIRDATLANTDLQSIFLNANHVDLDDGRRLIACQKPLASEIAGFHRMLLHENVGLIVDLTRSSERERQATYAPGRTGASQCCDHSDITVTCKKKQKLKALGAAYQQLSVGNATAAVTVARLHYSVWPVPGTIDAKALVALANAVESLTPDDARPTVIHCMSGTDRTATLMTFMAARKKIADEVNDTGLCSVGRIMVILMDVVARGRIGRGPSFLGNRDDFALLAMTLANVFSPAIYRSRRLAPPDLARTVRPGSGSHVETVPPAPAEATAVTAFQASAAPQEASGPKSAEVARLLHQTDPVNVMPMPMPMPTPAPRLCTQAGASLWNRLVWRLDGAPVAPVVASSEVGSNVEGVACQRATALQVMIKTGRRVAPVFLHASEVTFAQRPLVEFVLDSDGVRSAALGQSPLEFRFTERFLLYGLDSGKGLFEFVSISTHRNAIGLVENPIHAQLKQAFDAAAGSPDGLVLGGRYRAIGLTEIDCDEPDFRRFRLQVTDVSNPGRTSTMLLTQAGLKFEDNVLMANQIIQASELMDSHVATDAADPATWQQDPLTVSFSGIGRSAVLVVYREAVRRLSGVGSEEGVDALLEQIVIDGRRDRGPWFIHGRHQLEQLREAVLRQFALQGSNFQISE